MNKTTPTCRLHPSRSSHSDVQSSHSDVETILASSCDNTPTTSGNRYRSDIGMWMISSIQVMKIIPTTLLKNTLLSLELAVHLISWALDNHSFICIFDKIRISLQEITALINSIAKRMDNIERKLNQKTMPTKVKAPLSMKVDTVAGLLFHSSIFI